MTGYSARELIGKHFLDLIPLIIRDRLERFYRIQFVKKLPLTYNEFPILSKHGERFRSVRRFNFASKTTELWDFKRLRET